MAGLSAPEKKIIFNLNTLAGGLLVCLGVFFILSPETPSSWVYGEEKVGFGYAIGALFCLFGGINLVFAYMLKKPKID